LELKKATSLFLHIFIVLNLLLKDMFQTKIFISVLKFFLCGIESSFKISVKIKNKIE